MSKKNSEKIDVIADAIEQSMKNLDIDILFTITGYSIW